MNTVKKLAVAIAMLGALGIAAPAVSYADDQPPNVGASGQTGAPGAPAGNGGSNSGSGATGAPGASQFGGSEQLRDLFARLFPSVFRR